MAPRIDSSSFLATMDNAAFIFTIDRKRILRRASLDYLALNSYVLPDRQLRTLTRVMCCSVRVSFGILRRALAMTRLKLAPIKLRLSTWSSFLPSGKVASPRGRFPTPASRPACVSCRAANLKAERFRRALMNLYDTQRTKFLPLARGQTNTHTLPREQ